MNKTSVNTKSYLDYLRARRAKIDALIEAIEEFDDDGSSRDTSDDTQSGSAGIYADMTIAGAAIHFLKGAGKPQGTSVIVKALMRGSIRTKSKNLYRLVYNSLNTRLDKGQIVKSNGKWGLAEWSSEK